MAMLHADDLLLEGEASGVAVPEVFFPPELALPDLGCSSLEASASFALPVLRASYKRPRTEDELKEEELRQLQDRVKRLRDANEALQVSCDSVQNQASAALDEQQRLLQLVRALQPHKHALQVRPLESQGSSASSQAALAAAAAAEEDPDRFLALPHSPSHSQPGPAEPSMTPCRDSRRVQSAQLPCNRGPVTPLPARLEESPETAAAAAVAAAALAVNRCNPAAALLDLLHLAMARRLAAEQGDASPQQAEGPLQTGASLLPVIKIEAET